MKKKIQSNPNGIKKDRKNYSVLFSIPCKNVQSASKSLIKQVVRSIGEIKNLKIEAVECVTPNMIEIREMEK